MTRFLGGTQIGASAAALLPVLWMAGVLFTNVGTASYYSNYSAVQYFQPFGVVIGLVFAGAFIGCVAIACKMQNLLMIAAWTYNAVGSWSLVSTAILFMYGLSYLPLRMVGTLMSWIAPPVLILYFSAAVMLQHSSVVNERVSLASSDGAAAPYRPPQQHMPAAAVPIEHAAAPQESAGKNPWSAFAR